jgi:hypothetical protein
VIVTAGEMTLLSLNVCVFVALRFSRHGTVARNNSSLPFLCFNIEEIREREREREREQMPVM